MVTPDHSFRTRAATLLHHAVPFRTETSPDARAEKPVLGPSLPRPEEELNEKARLGSCEQDLKTTGAPSGNTIVRGQGPHRRLRLVPTWVDAHDEEEDDDEDQGSEYLPTAPPELQIAQHNNSPSVKSPQKYAQGHRWDQERDWVPAISSAHVRQSGLRWKPFIDYPVPPRVPGENDPREKNWLLENGADYSEPWCDSADLEKLHGRQRIKNKRQAWGETSQRVMLRNPLVPLIIRMNVWVFSLIALALGVSIYNYRFDGSIHYASPEMAIVVDAVALVYILYITYDEYTGKPLGLRSAKAKMRLIFLDLFFIVFDSANLSLAFQAVGDDAGQCDTRGVCGRQKALASVLLVALIAWLMTFSISVLRLIERVVQK